MACVMCGSVIEVRSGRVPRFCSGACRQRAYRVRAKRRARFMELAEGRWVRARGKRPVMVDGRAASSTDSSTWSSHAAVVASRAGDGLGVMLGGGLGCYDLDGCFDESGRLSSSVRDFVRSIPEPVLMVERSMSGRGLHVFVEASEGPGSRRGGVERYTKSRFIRTTFDEVDVT